AQILLRLVEAATAKRRHEFPSISQPFEIDLPFAPREKIVGERKRIGIFILQHYRGLTYIPSMLRREDCSAEHIKKPVHLCFHFITKLPDRMMYPRRKLDRELMRSRCD